MSLTEENQQAQSATLEDNIDDQIADDAQEELEETVDPIAALEEQVANYHDQLLRAHAEMENLRKRTADEVAKARKFSTEAFAESLLAVKDSLEAALSQSDQSLESLLSGVETTLKQLNQAFERNHMKEVAPAVGEAFDPHIHQAISSIASDEVAQNNVINCLQKGYTISERVLRPALVIVSSGKA